MSEHEKVSYEIKMIGCINILGYFLVTIKDDFLYCDPRSNKTSSKRIKLKDSNFLRIDNKLFEIYCQNMDKKSNINLSIFEIDYFEPTETFSRFPLNSSFCVGNVKKTGNFSGSACLFFISHEHLQLVNNKAN
ncbi:hypothetical protein ACTFIR_002495 [Dictyostelium discoideum]